MCLSWIRGSFEDVLRPLQGSALRKMSLKADLGLDTYQLGRAGTEAFSNKVSNVCLICCTAKVLQAIWCAVLRSSMHSSVMIYRLDELSMDHHGKRADGTNKRSCTI